MFYPGGRKCRHSIGGANPSARELFWLCSSIFLSLLGVEETVYCGGEGESFTENSLNCGGKKKYMGLHLQKFRHLKGK